MLTIYLNSTLIQGVLTLLKRIQNAPSRFTNGKYLYNCQCFFFCLWHQQIINPNKNKTVNNSCRTCLQQCTILSWISVLSRSKKNARPSTEYVSFRHFAMNLFWSKTGGFLKIQLFNIPISNPRVPGSPKLRMVMETKYYAFPR